MAKPEAAYVPFEEFLASLDEDSRAEWVDGRVERLSPASLRHQRIVGFLFRLLDEHVRARGLGEVVMAPFQVKLGPDLPGREPDLLFVARDGLSKMKGTYFEGAPDLVIEVSSPESAGRDRGEKFLEYEKARVREYWLIDPEREQVDVYRLEQLRYRPLQAEADGRFASSAVDGFRLDPVWVLRDPPSTDS
jgi:Uma2 family endonuclease